MLWINFKVCPHLFVPPEEFLKQLLNLVVNEVGPYVPFMDDDANEAAKELAAWKCLNILRALKYNHFEIEIHSFIHLFYSIAFLIPHRWNLGKTETILDDQEKCFKLAGILEEPKSCKVF